MATVDTGGVNGTTTAATDQIGSSAADSVAVQGALAQGQQEISAAQAVTSIDTAVSRSTAETARNIK
jgi:hypothetical protein